MEGKSEYITVAEAREILSVSKAKMSELLKPGGLLQAKPHPIDKRSKVLRRADVEALAAQLPKPKKEAA
jgi:hypothetical protein